jgi:hypothetical protein
MDSLSLCRALSGSLLVTLVFLVSPGVNPWSFRK